VSHHQSAPKLSDDLTTLGDLAVPLLRIAIIVGLIGLTAAILLGVTQDDSMRRFGYSYLVSFTFFLSISLGALFFVAIQHLTRSSWSVVVRRIAEVLSVNLPLLGLLGLPLIFLAKQIFPWAGDGGHVPAELLAHKSGYLNLPFFSIRYLLFFLIWSAMAIYFWRRSLKQDDNGDPRLTVEMERRSGVSLVLYAFTVTFISYDLLMSLDPAWFSTIFGPYFFTGGLVGFYALLTMLTFWLQRSGRLKTVIHVEHLHDYGKLLFAFIFFWAYLAFSQYMLYWYANIPEETAWLIRRQTNGWQWLGLVLLFGHFLIPFAGLISRYAKRTRPVLIFWAVWVFIMHYCDLYWIAMPEFSSATPAPHLIDLACFLGIGGIYFAGLILIARNHSLVPTRDPRLADSLGFENA
jgi:hypothetical protein